MLTIDNHRKQKNAKHPYRHINKKTSTDLMKPVEGIVFQEIGVRRVEWSFQSCQYDVQSFERVVISFDSLVTNFHSAIKKFQSIITDLNSVILFWNSVILFLRGAMGGLFRVLEGYTGGKRT